MIVFRIFQTAFISVANIQRYIYYLRKYKIRICKIHEKLFEKLIFSETFEN